MKKYILISLVCVVFACKEQVKETQKILVETDTENFKEVKSNIFTQDIEKTHDKETFLSNKAIKYDVEISFGGKKRLEGTITQLTNSSKIRIDKKEGTSIVYDNNEVFVNLSEAEVKGARFDIFTWSYFFSIPYKLNDEGTVWTSQKKNKWGEEMYDSAKLSFKSGTGDAPDDWYVVYKNPETNVLEGAAYIVSFGKGLAKAEKEPHVIKYSDFKIIDNVPFATKWTFHNWNEKEGYTNEIGEATISNIEFINLDHSIFEKLADSKLVEMPE